MLVLRHLKMGTYWMAKRIDSLVCQILKGPSEGWTTFILLLLSVMVAVWSVGRAQWAPAPGLYCLALCGVVLGLLLAKMRFNGGLLAISGLFVGTCLSFYQLTNLVGGPTSLDRHVEAGKRLFTWGQTFAGGHVSPEVLIISFFLLFASWLVGFICSWSFFRKQNIWGAVVPSGFIMVVSLAMFSTGAQRLLFYLYLFVVCLLVARLFVLQRDHDWKQRGVQRRHLDWVLQPEAFRFALVIVIVTSLIPTPSIRVIPIAAAWDKISSPVRVIREAFTGVIHEGPDEDPVVPHFFGRTSPFGANTTLGEEPVLIVRAPSAIYLRARSYDVYTHEGWRASYTQMISPELSAQVEMEPGSQKSRQADVSVKVLFSLTAGEVVYLAGYPIDMSIDYQLELLKPSRYDISMPESETELAQEAEGLPVDLREVFLRLWEMSQASSHELTESDIRSALPEDARVISCEFGTEGLENITVERRVPIPPDVVSVRTAGPVSAGDSYQTVVSLSTATKSDLLAAGTGYPGWILDRYLQLPDTMPSRVIDLAQELTKDVGTPYEKAIAVRDYLRTLKYTPDVEAPPDGADGVDYFLFAAKKGYCQYFASAMTVLLRVSGVPSRMVAGYGPGEPMEQYEPVGQDLRDTFVVRNSHSWSEVFFPGYGWIPFEPTPGYSPITGGEVNVPPQDAEGTDDPIIIEPDSTETDSPWSVRLMGVSLGLALFGAIMWLAWRRLLGQVLEPRAAYARIGYLAALCGMGPRENLTPQEYGRKLVAAVPEMAAAMDRIIYVYVRASYSNHDLSSEDRSNVARAWPRVRNHLLQHALHRAMPLRFYGRRSKS
ncbi:MAG: transglutaminase domain-containing protein [Dehalococcoidia bacterium]|nr:transglutaminase domain-containing protein [Dehalococcoidia bacterium]